MIMYSKLSLFAILSVVLVLLGAFGVGAGTPVKAVCECTSPADCVCPAGECSCPSCGADCACEGCAAGLCDCCNTGVCVCPPGCSCDLGCACGCD
jgi:hypothetical protein